VAILVGQQVFQDDQVIVIRSGQAVGLRPVERDVNRVTLLAQSFGHEMGDSGLAFDKQDSHG
jgi:hypothetical protein